MAATRRAFLAGLLASTTVAGLPKVAAIEYSPVTMRARVTYLDVFYDYLHVKPEWAQFAEQVIVR